MGLFNHLIQLGKKHVGQGQVIPNSPGQNQSPVAPQPAPLQSQRPKTLSELEREMGSQYVQMRPLQPLKPAWRGSSILNKIIWISILLGIPVAALWFANLPYPLIRRPVAKVAPILLLPSYMSIDKNYREAIALVEQADQLINQATSAADIELGEQKVKQAQASLDALPISFLYDYPAYHSWWYDWRFSGVQFDAARAKIGELDAKVFQEKNAQTAFVAAEQALTQAKQGYQQATTSTDKQLAIAPWQTALDQLEQVPATTVAGKIARQKLIAYERDFQKTVGLAAGNEQVAAMIAAAQGFGWEAAKLGQNPPHPVEEWRQIESLWQEAIHRLERISPDDIAGYAIAQRLLTEYQSNLAQVKIRRQAEENSARTLQAAQQNIQAVQANYDNLNHNQLISQLQGIINQLERVDNGTTAYPEAQQLLFFAKSKLQEFQP